MFAESVVYLTIACLLFYICILREIEPKQISAFPVPCLGVSSLSLDLFLLDVTDLQSGCWLVAYYQKRFLTCSHT